MLKVVEASMFLDSFFSFKFLLSGYCQKLHLWTSINEHKTAFFMVNITFRFKLKNP